MLHKRGDSKALKRRWTRLAIIGGFVSGLCLPAFPLSAQVNGPTLMPASSQSQFHSPLTTGTTDAAAATLRVHQVPSDYVGIVGAQFQVQYHGDPNVRITTDPKTGQLLVLASETVQQKIAADIATFLKQNNIERGDRGMQLASYRQQSYQLQQLSWRELEDSLRRLLGHRLTVTTERNGELANLQMPNSSGMQDVMQIDRRTNEVKLLGTGASIAGWAQVLWSLDQPQTSSNRQTEVVQLSPAEPRGVKRAMQLISASIQQDDSAPAQAQVDVADGDEPATAMGSLESLSSESGLFGDVQIEFIEEIDLVIIRGSKRDVERTLEVIEKIKQQAAETQPEVEVYALEHANAQAVATLVTELYENIYAPRQGSVSITALGQPNALLLIGRKEVIQSVKELVEKIDRPLAPDDQLKVIHLRNASAVDVESRVREFFVEQPGGDDANRAGLGTRVKVLADYRTNSLIVQASPREMIELETLISQLDVESTTAQNEVRVFRLKNTLAEDMQAVIDEVITGQNQTGTGGTQQATPPSGKLSIVGPEGSVESGILAGVVVTADPSVNALVVRAPAQSMELIGRLIQELDQLPNAEARIKVFTIEHGDATQLAATLQQLFGLQVTAGQSTTGGLFGLGNLQQAALTAGGEGSLVQLRITQDIRTNSIIVSGSSSDLEVVEALLYRLDEEGVENRRTEVIWLRNATAEFVATAINDYLLRQQQINQQLLLTNQAISVFDQADREVFIVAEPQTNSLILSATPRYFDTIMQVIERLDRRPPLVSIQVLIAEVQLDDSFELGSEWGLQDGLLFDRQSATGGTLGSPVFNLGTPLTGPSGGPGQTQNVAGQALSSFGVGRTNSGGLGGLVLSASSEAVGVLVRALQTSGRLQILSRPQITTMDAREASTLVGQQVPRVGGVTQSQFGQTFSAEDVPVGLGLAVLPRVNQDGLIVMQVQVQNSTIGDTNTGIPVGFGPNGEVIRSPIINSTEASTTVSAYSGQTVVFAGLISKSRQSSRTQIPFLGSIPWIGAAFRYDTETEQRRELLVILTPRIIQTDDDYEMLKQVESSRMSWCLADILNMHGDVGLSGGNGLWGPARSPVIYPDLQPTIIYEPGMVPNGTIPLEEIEVPDPYGPSVIESIPLGQGNPVVPAPTKAPQLNSNAATQSTPQLRTASFQIPVQQPSGETSGVQVGAYR